MRGAARRLRARRGLSTLSPQPRAATKQMGPYRPPGYTTSSLRELGRRLGTEPAIIEGAEHFFFGKLYPLGEAVERWLRRWAV